MRIVLKKSNPPSIYGVQGRKRESASVGYAGELLLTPEPDLLPQKTTAEKCYFPLLMCFAIVRQVGRHCLTLEGLLGDRHGERCWASRLKGM